MFRTTSPPPDARCAKRRRADDEPTPARVGAGPSRSAPRLQASDQRTAVAAALQPPAPRRAAIEPAKASPYLPEGKGRPRGGLNGQVVARTPQQGDKTLMCRHYAVQYAASEKKAQMLETFSDPQRIALHFGAVSQRRELDDAFIATMVDVPQSAKHLMKANRLGGYLAHVAERLDAAHGGEANIVLITPTHAMALHVQRKERKPDEPDAGASYFAVKLYDPNRTSNHIRVEAASPQALEPLRFKDLNRAGPSLYFAGVADPHLMTSCQDLALSLPQAELASKLNGHALFLAVNTSLHDAVDSTAALLRTLPTPLHPEVLQELLFARPAGMDAPALNRSMRMWREGGMHSYAQLLRVAVQRHGLEPGTLTALLRGASDTGTPALHAGMDYGNAQALREFGLALPQFDLPRSTTIELLAARDANGVTALHAASKAGHADVVHAYADVLLAQGDRLTPSDKADLFAGHGPERETACQVAQRNGHTEAARAHQARQADFHG